MHRHATKVVAEHLVSALRTHLPATAGPELDAYEDYAEPAAEPRRSQTRAWGR